MHLMAEINRILKPGGHLVLTTPNIVSTRALAAILQGYHPGFFPAYIKPKQPGAEVDPRHAREYAPAKSHSCLRIPDSRSLALRPANSATHLTLKGCGWKPCSPPTRYPQTCAAKISLPLDARPGPPASAILTGCT